MTKYLLIACGLLFSNPATAQILQWGTPNYLNFYHRSFAPSIGSTGLGFRYNPSTGVMETAHTPGTWATIVALTSGSATNLTPSNGGIVYSTASALAVLSGTVTAGQILRSGASTAPSWSTATYPATAGTAANVLRSDGTNFLSAALAAADLSNGVTGAGAVVLASVTTLSSLASIGTITTGTWNAGSVTSSGQINSTSTTDASSTSTGGITTSGGISSQKRGYVNNITIASLGGNSMGTGTTFSQIGWYIAGTLTAAGGFARYWQTDFTLAAVANNDDLTVLRITPTITKGSFTGVVSTALTIGNVDYALLISGGMIQQADATDATTTTSGSVQIAGGASVRKRIWADGLSTSSAAQTSYVCRASTGELIAVAVANTCATSSARFKENVQSLPAVAGLAEIMRLRPVSYNFKPEGIFHDSRERVGLIAEEVAQIDPRLVGFDNEGQPHSVHYEVLTAPLILAIQQLKATNDKIETRLQRLEAGR